MNPIPPKVSVILSAFNAERTIGAAIDSVLKQSVPDIELIICDDASTDQTVRIVSEIIDPRVIFIKNQTNLGPGPSRDRAIKLAQGRWLAITDADDIWLPYRLEKLIAEINSDSDFMVFDNLMLCFDSVYGMIPYKKLRNSNSFCFQDSYPVEVPIEKYLRLNQLLIKPLIPLQWVHRTLAHHGDYRFGEDTRFFLQLMAAGLRMKYHPEPMYYYRLTPSSLTSHRDRDFQMLQILEELKPRFLFSAHVLSGLEYKIAQVRKSVRYTQILSLLKKKQLRNWACAIASDPWFIPMFFKKLIIDLQYIFHGFLYQANIRK